MNVALIYGGASREHDVSLLSAAGILRAFGTDTDIAIAPIGIDRSGTWYLQDRSRRMAEAMDNSPLTIDFEPENRVVVAPADGLKLIDGTTLDIDCAFPIVHGETGEDGVLQGALETAAIPYVGSGVVGSAVGMDKIRAKQIWERSGLPVVPYVMIPPYADGSLDLVVAQTDREIQSTIGYPVFVKPNAAGSSVGITRVNAPGQLYGAVQDARDVDATVLIERALPVREIETSVLGNGSPVAFQPGEVVPAHEFYDYDAKYIDPAGARLEIPAQIDDETADNIRSLSIRAFTAVGAIGMARVDCFIDRTDGTIYLNEINTLPGFTPISMYPKMVEAGGTAYADLLTRLVELALERGSTSVRVPIPGRAENDG